MLIAGVGTKYNVPATCRHATWQREKGWPQILNSVHARHANAMQNEDSLWARLYVGEQNRKSLCVEFIAGKTRDVAS